MNARSFMRSQFNGILKSIRRGERPVPRVLVYVVELPNRELETTVVNSGIMEKLDYIEKTYDENFDHNFSDEVSIVAFITV